MTEVPYNAAFENDLFIIDSLLEIHNKVLSVAKSIALEQTRKVREQELLVDMLQRERDRLIVENYDPKEVIYTHDA